VAWLIAGHNYRIAFAVVIFAGLTDWADGTAARRLGVSGRVGVILDPLADKVMLVVLFLSLAFVRLIPIWIFGLVIGRDLVIVTGAVLVRWRRRIRTFRPAVLGKISTFFQIVLVVLVLLRAAFPNQLILWLERIAPALTTIFTAASGLQYVLRGIDMARRPERWGGAQP
jgi:cardiolipin synthase